MVMNAPPDLFFCIAQDGTFLPAGAPSECRLLIAPREFLGKTVGEVLSDEHARLVTEHIRLALQTDETQTVEYQRSERGVVRHYEARLAAAGDGVVALVRDITERRQAERKTDLQEAQLREAQVLEAVSQLAGGVAHEFNNLLTVIRGNAELALNELNTDDPSSSHLLRIHRAALRAAKLTRQLLAFAQCQMLRPQVLDVNRVLKRLARSWGRVNAGCIDLELALCPGEAMVWADEAALKEVLTELTRNALDAMPEGGTLRIETARTEVDDSDCEGQPDRTPGDYVRVTVTDTGMAMDRTTRARLFWPFFTTKEVGKGVGLGLSAAYGAVKQHGGWITVGSEGGRGTRFDVHWPAAEGSPTEQ